MNIEEKKSKKTPSRAPLTVSLFISSPTLAPGVILGVIWRNYRRKNMGKCGYKRKRQGIEASQTLVLWVFMGLRRE